MFWLTSDSYLSPIHICSSLWMHPPHYSFRLCLCLICHLVWHDIFFFTIVFFIFLPLFFQPFSAFFSQSNSQQTSLYLISMERLISWPSTIRVPMLPHTTGIIGDRCPRSTSITTGTLYFPMIPSTA